MNLILLKNQSKFCDMAGVRYRQFVITFNDLLVPVIQHIMGHTLTKSGIAKTGRSTRTARVRIIKLTCAFAVLAILQVLVIAHLRP